MKTKLLKQLRDDAKQCVYLTNRYSSNNNITIVYEDEYDKTYYFNPFSNWFFAFFSEKDTFKTVEEALPFLEKARRTFIEKVFREDYQKESKGAQKRRLEQEKFLSQF
jgi:hypothetical protein